MKMKYDRIKWKALDCLVKRGLEKQPKERRFAD